MQEKDMYAPVKAFFEQREYTVKSEIKDCDMMCEKNGEFVICELKRSLNLDLILQGTARQRLCDYVYLCIPSKKANRTYRKQNQLYSMLRRLSLGLLLVHGDEKDSCVSLAIEAKAAGINLNRKKSQKTKKEFINRIGDFNVGGCNKTKIVTYYRECAILIAALLHKNEKFMSPKELVNLGAVKTAGGILRSNRYGWFNHEARGLYSLSDSGKMVIENEYCEVASVLLKKIISSGEESVE